MKIPLKDKISLLLNFNHLVEFCALDINKAIIIITTTKLIFFLPKQMCLFEFIPLRLILNR